MSRRHPKSKNRGIPPAHNSPPPHFVFRTLSSALCPPRLRPVISCLIIATVGTIITVHFARRPLAGTAHYRPQPAGSVTFNKDIAPILFEHCSTCHRPGESGPFTLISYADVKKRARQIAEVTETRFMPPWLPEDGHEELLDRRRLTREQIGLINQWAAEGAPEGLASDLPPTPKWTEGWQLGPPDLVVTMPEAYTLPTEGKDVYRNFIIPVPTTQDRFVKGFEFRPSSKSVHHAFIRLDRTHESRVLAAREPGPGFGGMVTPPSAESPNGHFLGWQPGRGHTRSPDGLPWILPAGVDIVLLMHMQPRGKPEPVQPSIGFYFTDVPPTNTPMKFGLKSYAIDIPAGASNYVVEQTAVVPEDSDLLSLLPHTHYLGKRLEGFAVLPDGTRKTLLLIPQWDFNWQSDFRFKNPVFLPKGTTLGMHYTFDNSTNNLHQPHKPPLAVTYGLQTTQEMAELHFQLLARNAVGRDRLEAAAVRLLHQNDVGLNQRLLREDPSDGEAMLEIAKVMLVERDLRGAEGMFRRAIAARPALADAHYSLAVVFFEQSNLPEAERESLEALRLDPQNSKAANNAGIACMRQGKLDDAARLFQEALRMHPGDKFAQDNLDLVRNALKR